MKDITAAVSLSFYMNDRDKGVRLKVDDAASGFTLVTAELTPEQLRDVLSSSYTHVPAQVTERWDVVGKRRTTRRVVLGHFDGESSAERLQAAVAEARLQRHDGEEVEVRRTNEGYVAVYVRYVDSAEQL